jgi:hypothetical protein
MNTYSNIGHADVTDLPNLAFANASGQAHGDFGATLRQSLIGLDVSGPTLGGAATSADLQADFFGGFPGANYGVTAGLFRLRTARMHFYWGNTSIMAGQDTPLISPLSPTSYATLAEPAMSWSGNLWVWTPQIRLEHRFTLSDSSAFVLQGGIMDSLTEQIPPMQFNRVATPGEASKKPAFALRTGWTGKWLQRNASFGVGGYYGRQVYGNSRNVDAWAATVDWNLPLGSYFTVTGEFYRGRALGGLGGGIWNSVLYNGSPSSPIVRVIGLNDIGGWSQLKFAPLSKLEFNLAAGTDNPYASDLELFPAPSGAYFPPLTRNQTFFVNSIYRPRSNLLFALEYRRLRTYNISNTKQTLDHVNLAVGVSF